MPPLQTLAAPGSRGLRASQAPKTPEPLPEGEVQPPSPPRPRFRLKRRNASNLNAPTQQFLASVAAADIPIPSIEEPTNDEAMVDSAYATIPTHDFDEHLVEIEGSTRGRTFSPPETPARNHVPSLSPKRYPNWSIDSAISSLGSSPAWDSSRPSTGRSTYTSSSIFSRYSLSSELSQCASPESERVSRFGLKLSVEDGNTTIRPPLPQGHQRQRKAPWTKKMTDHLWATYQLYMQDPTVTPFALGRSGVPPYGVLYRVAREAKKAWKGSKHQQRSEGSGGSTPTAESTGTFVEWPHTCAATRSRLRDLCRANVGTSTSRNNQYFSHSPTPFGRAAARQWKRRSTPARSPSVFSSSEMVMSLAVSTSDSMQAEGPLAQLARPQVRPPNSHTSFLKVDTADTILAGTDPESRDGGYSQRLGSPFSTDDDRRSSGNSMDGYAIHSLPEPTIASQHGAVERLGSPFVASRSYGPSSSQRLAVGLGDNLQGSRQTHTTGPRRALGSPARLGASIYSTTQKRRFKFTALEPRRSKRPSLASDLWNAPVSPSPIQSLNDFTSSSSNQHEEHFVPRTNVQELMGIPAHNIPSPTLGMGQPEQTSAKETRPRLGSPFSATSTSFSFPNRLLKPAEIGLGAIRRPFASVRKPTTSNGNRQPLASRLAYVDERLRDFRRRDLARRRSESPL